jgi:UDP-glucose:(heptosyl)LPS alpha-1,3-glucosyltransferase
MRFAFCLFKYFPYGGLQRGFLELAHTCVRRGHEVDVYTGSWSGDRPDGLRIFILPPRRLTNHGRYKSFAARLARRVAAIPYDAVVGFNKMPGLDVYFASDVCYAFRVKERNFLYRHSARCRTLLALERAVFDPLGKTHIITISTAEQKHYMECYATPKNRFHPVPPGIARDRLGMHNIGEMRADFRKEFGLSPDTRLILMVGSDFRRKGAARAIRALAVLPGPVRVAARLMIVGKGNPGPYRRLAYRFKVGEQVDFMGERDDVPRFLAGADLLLHPAEHENTGTVLIEAMAAGLPVLATDVCGYGFHVEKAGAGRLVPSPFRQETLDRMLAEMLCSAKTREWEQNGKTYVAVTDVSSRHERSADVIEAVAAGL